MNDVLQRETKAKKVMPISPGRPKGTPNKVTGQLKEMILQALDESGGVEYLKRQADDNPNGFMSLIGKVLPMTVLGAGADGSHLVSVHVKFD